MWWDWLWWYAQPDEVDNCDPSAIYDYSNSCQERTSLLA